MGWILFLSLYFLSLRFWMMEFVTFLIRKKTYFLFKCGSNKMTNIWGNGLLNHTTYFVAHYVVIYLFMF